MFDDTKEFVSSYFKSVLRNNKRIKTPEAFWKLNESDFITYFIIILPTFIIWLGQFVADSITRIIKYNDGPLNLFCAISMYSIKNSCPFKEYMKIDGSFTIYNFPMYPIFIRICSYICFGNYEFGSFISILLANFLLVYSFRRMLIAYKSVENIEWSTCLISIFPFHFVTSHSTLNNASFYASMICFALIFFKFHYFNLLNFSLIIICSTRVDGVYIVLGFAICYALQRKYMHLLKVLANLLAYFFISWFFHTNFYYFPANNNSFRYYKSTKMPRIPYLIDSLCSYFYGFTLFIGCFLCCNTNLPISIASLFSLIYMFPIYNLDFNEYILPYLMLTAIPGYDCLLHKKFVKIAVLISIPILIAIIIYRSFYKIRLYTCGNDFYSAILDFQNYEY